MHRSQLGGIVIDCHADVELDVAARFWSQALGYPVRTRDDLDASRYVDLAPPPDDPHFTVQRVTHASRCHLDIETDDMEAEAARLIALGAQLVERRPAWTTLKAPTGHRFCLVKVGRRNFAAQANTWRDAGRSE